MSEKIKVTGTIVRIEDKAVIELPIDWEEARFKLFKQFPQYTNEHVEDIISALRFLFTL